MFPGPVQEKAHHGPASEELLSEFFLEPFLFCFSHYQNTIAQSHCFC